MMEREYFTVETTSMRIEERGALAIYAGDKPRKNADGSTSCFMRAPMLLIPPGLFKEPEAHMAKVARILNEHAAEFFDSANADETPEPSEEAA